MLDVIPRWVGVGAVALIPLAAGGCGTDVEGSIAVPGGSVAVKPDAGAGVKVERSFEVRNRLGSLDYTPATGDVSVSPLWIPLALTYGTTGGGWKLDLAFGVGTRSPVGGKVKWELWATSSRVPPAPDLRFGLPGTWRGSLLQPDPLPGLMGRPGERPPGSQAAALLEALKVAPNPLPGAAGNGLGIKKPAAVPPAPK